MRIAATEGVWPTVPERFCRCTGKTQPNPHFKEPFAPVRRTILWQDNLAFFQDTLRKSPDFVPAQNEIANALYTEGKTKEANTIITSIQLPDKLINRQYGLISKASVLINSGDFTGARALMNQALADPGKHEVEILEKLLKIDRLQLLGKKASIEELYAGSVKTLSRLIELTGDPLFLRNLFH